MQRVVSLCVSLSAGLYLVFSMVAYANFGRVVQGNVLLNCKLERGCTGLLWLEG